MELRILVRKKFTDVCTSEKGGKGTRAQKAVLGQNQTSFENGKGRSGQNQGKGKRDKQTSEEGNANAKAWVQAVLKPHI